MFNSLKKMIEEKRFSSIIFFTRNVELKMERMEDNYNVIFQAKEGFEEYSITKEEFLKYLENIMQKLVFKRSGWRIINTVKMNTVCSFRIEKEEK